MIFQEELAKKVMAGEKTQTRRLPSDNPRSPWYRGGCKYQVGRTYSVNPGRGKRAVGLIRMLGVWSEPLGFITAREAAAEGFDGRREFLKAWEEINGTVDLDGSVWVLRFEAVS